VGQAAGLLLMGQLPSAQLDAPPSETANDDNIFSVLRELHFSQGCCDELDAFSKNSVTCPHFWQRYSKSGIAFSLLHDEYSTA